MAPVAQGTGDWLVVGPGQRCGRNGARPGSRLVASFTLDGLEVIQETVLWEDAERVEFRTHVDGYREKDRLLRVRFPADVPGGLPVYQTATAVIGRPFGVVDVDSADHWYTLDNPAHQWFGLGSTARVRTGAGVTGPGDRGGRGGLPGQPGGLAAGCAEVIRDLMVALAAAGVTATCSQADGSEVRRDRRGLQPARRQDRGRRAGRERVHRGGPGGRGPGMPGAAARLAAAGRRLWVPAARSRAEAFAPSADVRGAGRPAGADRGRQRAGRAGLGGHGPGRGPGRRPGRGARGHRRRRSGRQQQAPLADRSVALLNRGTPGGVVTPDGTLHMSLMRSCSGWPSRIWIDGDPRTAPDGSSFAWQHWSHTFEYALAAGPGDWRTAGLQRQRRGLQPRPDRGGGRFAARTRQPGASLLSVEPASVTLSAVKPRGNPLASGRSAAGTPAPRWPRPGGRGRGHGAAAGNQRAAHDGAGPAGPARLRGVADRPARGDRRRAPAGGGRRGYCRHAGLRHGRPWSCGPGSRARAGTAAWPPSNRSSRSTRVTGCTGRARRRPGTCR